MLDDFGLIALNDDARRDLLEILDDRHGRKSTLATSDLPVDTWLDYIGELPLRQYNFITYCLYVNILKTRRVFSHFISHGQPDTARYETEQLDSLVPIRRITLSLSNLYIRRRGRYLQSKRTPISLPCAFTWSR